MSRYRPAHEPRLRSTRESRAMAFLEGRDHVIPDDVKFLCPYVFPHRIFLTTKAIAEEVSVSQMISEMLSNVPVPKE